MSKDYSKLKNIKYIQIEDYNEKEIETKYSEFLDWLKDDIEKRELNNTICKKDKYIPISFKNILFSKIPYRCVYIPNVDIKKYLNNLKISIYYTEEHGYRYSCYTFTSNSYDCNINQNIKKIQILEQKISSLEQTNQDILKKLEEQIQLNSKLCERIFEMKEEV